MKKLFAIILALTLMLSLSVTVFAETYEDQSAVNVKKSYKLAGVTGVSPAGTFTLEQVGDGVVVDGEATSAPALGTITGATYTLADGATTNGNEKNIVINLPTAAQFGRVGIYKYTLKEVDPNVAGVTVFDGEITLVVTVIEQDGQIRVAAVHCEEANEDGSFESTTAETAPKTDTFENTYTAGSLTVTKAVEGNMGDRTYAFEITVKFTSDKQVLSAVTYVDGTETKTLSWSQNETTNKYEATAVVKLAHDASVTFSNLPKDVSYTVEETDKKVKVAEGATAAEYTVEYEGATGTIDNAAVTAKVTNTKEGDVDTGITLDSVPYILLLAAGIATVVVMIIRKRRIVED